MRGAASCAHSASVVSARSRDSLGASAAAGEVSLTAVGERRQRQRVWQRAHLRHLLGEPGEQNGQPERRRQRLQMGSGTAG